MNPPAMLLQELEASTSKELEASTSKVAFLSTPSVYFSLKKGSDIRTASWVFDFDDQWAKDPHFFKYDFNKPEEVPAELLGTFDCCVIDPPFITREVWEKYAATAKLLLKEGGKVICSTVAENAPFMEELLGAKPCAFQPSIPNLIYQYNIFINFEPTLLVLSSALAFRDELQTLHCQITETCHACRDTATLASCRQTGAHEFLHCSYEELKLETGKVVVLLSIPLPPNAEELTDSKDGGHLETGKVAVLLSIPLPPNAEEFTASNKGAQATSTFSNLASSSEGGGMIRVARACLATGRGKHEVVSGSSHIRSHTMPTEEVAAAQDLLLGRAGRLQQLQRLSEKAIKRGTDLTKSTGGTGLLDVKGGVEVSDVRGREMQAMGEAVEVDEDIGTNSMTLFMFEVIKLGVPLPIVYWRKIRVRHL
eukprot:gene4056-14142_t